MSLNKNLFAGLAGLILFCAAACSPIHELSGSLLEAHKKNEAIPLVSVQYPKLGERSAYSVQKAYVDQRLKNDKIAGFKAGLTSKAGQKKFGASSPVAGVLFESGKKSDGALIRRSKFQRLMVEIEIGFEAGETINQPLKNIDELYKKIRRVMPVVELPDLGFADMKKLKAVDIIAANAAAAQFITGEKKKAELIKLNEITAKLSLNDEMLNWGKGGDALGNQWSALLWLVNNMLKHGWVVEPGQILITGSLGKMIPGDRGEYRADFGELGTISFSIE